MNLEPQFILQVLVAMASGAGAYTAIRADLARMHERLDHTKESADQAHKRIDQMMGQHKCS